MRTIPTIVAAALVALLLAVAARPGAGLAPLAGVAKACPKGSVTAVIAGERTCLRHGKRCANRYDRQYHRYGFHCHTGRLTRRAAPAPPSRNMQLVANVAATGAVGMDLAFWRDLMFASDMDGFRVVDISSPDTPNLLARVRCPAGGGDTDISVWEQLVFVSVMHPVAGPTCERRGGSDEWQGIRIFEISNPRAPRYIGAVETPCGAHAHTLVPDLDDDRVLLYVSIRSSRCSVTYGRLPIVEVPLAEPGRARVLKEQPLGGDGRRGCFDIGAFPAIGLAAAACGAEGQIWDISDLANPDTEHAIHVTNPRLNLWHSASFSWDGKVLAFGDEAYGGRTNVCTRGWGDSGAIWLYRIARPAWLGHFKIPRAATSACTVHYYNFIPTGSDRTILVSGWYAGGTSVVDVTNSAAPREIAFAPGNIWAAYWYNGFVYASDLVRGINIYRVAGVGLGETQHLDHLNPQTQEVMIR